MRETFIFGPQGLLFRIENCDASNCNTSDIRFRSFFFLFLSIFFIFMNTQPVSCLMTGQQTFDLQFVLILNPNQAVKFSGVLTVGVLTECEHNAYIGLPEKSTLCCQKSLLFLHEIS